MRTGRGDGLVRVALPGGDRDVGHPPPLAPQLAPRIGIAVQAGAQPQRPLWASTGTKDPSLPDTLYVDTLIGPDTVNTMPPKTMDAFRERGTVASV